MSDGVIVVNAEHWLDKDGELPVDGPPELYRNALRMAQCIEYGGPLPKGTLVSTLIQCRWRPGGVACRQTLIVAKTDRDEIEVFCLSCRREEFQILNWQSTMWAEGQPDPLPISAEAEPILPELSATISQQLTRALTSVGSGLSVQDVQRMVVTSDSPNMVVQEVLGSIEAPGMKKVQAVVDALMAVWNATPRSELGDRSPAEVYSGSASRSEVTVPDKVGRNEPCPCASGRKYKKCCGALH